LLSHPFSKKDRKESPTKARTERKKPKNMTIYASSLQENRNKEVVTFSLFLVMTL
jgi:hypothetical protein